MNEAALLHNYLILGAILFGIGLTGFVARRNLIVMFLAAEIMLLGVALNLVAWSRFNNDWGGQMFVVFIIAIAACEAAIALALTVMLFSRARKLDVAVWNALREDNQPDYVDEEPLPPAEEEDRWPSLTPAGPEPIVDPEKTRYRSHV